MAPPAMLVPSARFGRVLVDVRQSVGFDLDEMAERSAGRFTAHDLAAFEAGLDSVDDETVEALASVYGVESRLLTPPRGDLVIDLVRGEVVSGDHHVTIPTDAEGPGEVLERYLQLVHVLRHLPPDAEIPLRTPDLEVLADALDLSVAEVSSRLRRLMAAALGKDLEARRRRGLRWIPAVGLVVAAALAVVIVAARDTDSDPVTGTRTGSTTASDPAREESPAPAPGPAVVDADTATEGTAPDPFAPVPVDPGETSVEVPPIRYERDDPGDDPGEVVVIGE